MFQWFFLKTNHSIFYFCWLKVRVKTAVFMYVISYSECHFKFQIQCLDQWMCGNYNISNTIDRWLPQIRNQLFMECELNIQVESFIVDTLYIIRKFQHSMYIVDTAWPICLNIGYLFLKCSFFIFVFIWSVRVGMMSLCSLFIVSVFDIFQLWKFQNYWFRKHFFHFILMYFYR